MMTAGSSETPRPEVASTTTASAERPTPDSLSVSPSLFRARRGEQPSFEVKFVVEEAIAVEIERQLLAQLTLDPHADPHLGGAYRVTTIYFDTPEWHVLRRVGRHRLRKYRLRRYGDSSELFVERKLKRERRVRKMRHSVNEERLAEVLEAQALKTTPGGWFGRQLARQSLSPTCRVHYLRRAFFGQVAEGPVRATLDRQLHGAPLDGWSLRPTSDETPILVDRVICEFKFRGAMPAFFKQIVQALQLAPAGFSKYRHGMWLFGPDHLRRDPNAAATTSVATTPATAANSSDTVSPAVAAEEPYHA